MTSEIFLENTFFAYFFNVGDYLLILFAFAVLVVLVASFLKFFLTDE